MRDGYSASSLLAGSRSSSRKAASCRPPATSTF